MNDQELNSFLSHNKKELLILQLCGFEKRHLVISYGYGDSCTPRVSF